MLALAAGLAALAVAWRLTGSGGSAGIATPDKAAKETRAAERPEEASVPEPSAWSPEPSARYERPREETAQAAQAPPPSDAGFPAAPRAQPSAVREPAPAAAPSPPDLVLNAISERDGHAVALINDRLVREGDEFDGVKILHIGDAEVEVERAGRRSVIRF